mgnify:CR=1 FL=1
MYFTIAALDDTRELHYVVGAKSREQAKAAVKDFCGPSIFFVSIDHVNALINVPEKKPFMTIKDIIRMKWLTAWFLGA